MNPLLKRFASLRLKVRLLDGWQGMCALVALVVGVAVTVGVLDYFAHLPTIVRAAALVGLLVGSGAIAYRYLVRPFGKPCDDLNLALRVEEAYPELNDSLASTVQFLKQSPEDLARVGGSAALREHTVAATIEKASQCDFARVLDRRGAALFGAAACGIVLVASLVVSTHRDYAGIAFWRFIEPFGQHTWTQMTVDRLKNDKRVRVDPYKQEKIAIKQPYHIQVNLTGQLPEKLKQARVEIDGQIRTDSHETILRADGAAYFIKRFDMAAQRQKFKFRIVYNDGAFPARAGTWHEVEVLPEPKLVALDNQPSPQITLYPPAYTDLPKERHLPAGMRNIELYAGTKVVYRARADRPLKEAWIAYHTTNPAVLPAAVFAASLGQLDPLQVAVAARAACENTLWSRIPVSLSHHEEDGSDEKDKSVMSATFTPWIDGRYSLYMNDKYELEGRDDGDMHVLNDPLPDVKLLQPGSSVTARPDGKLAFKFLVTDEHFAVKSVFVEYRKKKAADGNWSDPQRTVLYDAKGYGSLIPEMLAKASYATPGSARTYPKLPMRGPDLRLRPKKLDFQTLWSLRNQFKEGELVEIQVCAADFCDVFSTREPGRSHVIELRIVGVRQLVQEADLKLGQIKNELRRVQKLQQQALDTVKETKANDKIEAKDVDKFIDEVEGPQRGVKDRVGNTPQEGLRKDLNELRRTLRDNNLEGTQAYRDAGEIKGTLDNIAQEELQKIEPRIADVRNELTQNNKNTPKTKQKLEETAKLQKNVLDGLNELIGKMDPTAKLDDQKNQLRDIIDREKKNLLDLEELNARKQDLEKAFPEDKARIEKDQRDKIAQKAQEQRELAQQTEKLLKELRAEKEHQEKLGNKDNAKKLEEAIEKLETPKALPMLKQQEDKGPVNAQMKDIAKQLDNKSEAPQKTLEQQKQVLKDLESALDALEGRNEDMTRQDIKDRQQAEKKIDELDKKLQKLRDEFKKAEMIEDKEERLKKKEELAAQAEKAVEDIEKTRRELARLQEQHAANELNQAADKVDGARKKAQNSDNPDQDLKDAQQQLALAKEDLKKAEEQLARELLIKIADQLKGIKERQDAVLQRSEDFHPKVIKLKSWTDPLLDTIDGNRDAQKDIAEETDGVKDKLKEAKVFHSVLERAKKSMDDAGAVMKARREEGRQRRYLDKNDGELMNADELKDEAEWHADTTKHQKQASQRLDRILDALKEEIAKKPQPRKDPDQVKNDPEKKEEKKGGIRPQDGIPSKAELKLIKGEQLDLNERTEDFAKRNPDVKNLNDVQRRELRELEVEQERLQELFQQILPPTQLPKEGDLP